MNKFQFVKLFLLSISLCLISCATEKEGAVAAAITVGLGGDISSRRLQSRENFPKSFPFPPPKASSYTEIKNELLFDSYSGQKYTFNDVDKSLRQALDNAGYAETSYYQVPDGFALVTRLEQINEDGTPKPKEIRWLSTSTKPRIFSISDYLKQLFTANPGYYRIIVFMVTSQSFNQDPKQKIAREEAENWLLEGDMKLPKSIGEIPYTREHTCTALIYEFERTNSAEEKTIFVNPSPVPGKSHLVRSGLFKGLN